MRSSFKIDFNKLRQDNLKELFRILEEVLHSFGADYYVIGAVARDSWFTKEDVSSRTTKDVDIAVFLSDQSQYQKIKDTLVSKYGFVESKTNAYALHTPFSYPIDLMPFGALEIDDSVKVEGQGLTVINVNGFQEVFRHGIIPVKADEDFEFQVATLPALVLLKLIAYDDRPEHRVRDIQDVAQILTSYFDIESDLIYDQHSDLFSREDLDLVDYSAITIGREIGLIVTENKSLKERILNILHLSDQKNRHIPEIMAGFEEIGLTIERSTTLLNEILQGINEVN